MSTNRGASESRKIRRAGVAKIDFRTGEIKKRPFPNSANPKRKKTHKFVQPTMTVERNGEEVTVPCTRTVSYKRRVFPDNEGCFPGGMLPEQISVSVSPIKDKTVYCIQDTKEVPVHPYRVKLNAKHD